MSEDRDVRPSSNIMMVALSRSGESLQHPNGADEGDADPESLRGSKDDGHQGEHPPRRMGWVKLTVCLIVEAIALGTLSIPSAFAAVGMVYGVILTVSIGLAAIYTSYVIGQVKLKYRHVEHYADAVRLIWVRMQMGRALLRSSITSGTAAHATLYLRFLS